MLAGLMASPPSVVTLISVHDDAGLRYARRFVGKEEVDDYLREQCEKDLVAARKFLDGKGVRHDIVLRIGHVAQEIVDCAVRGKYGLVVLGAKGRGTMADVLVGSVSQRVLASCKVPVLLVR